VVVLVKAVCVHMCDNFTETDVSASDGSRHEALAQDKQAELLAHSYADLVYRLQNLLPARSHDIRSHLDSTIFASNVQAQGVPDVKSAVDFTWHMLRMIGTADMDCGFEEAYTTIMTAPAERRIILFLRNAHAQLDMINRNRRTSH
jgi:hypothetical protein